MKLALLSLILATQALAQSTVAYEPLRIRGIGMFPSTSSSGGSPGSPTLSLQYNNAGSFAGLPYSEVEAATGSIGIGSTGVGSIGINVMPSDNSSVPQFYTRGLGAPLIPHPYLGGSKWLLTDTGVGSAAQNTKMTILATTYSTEVTDGLILAQYGETGSNYPFGAVNIGSADIGLSAGNVTSLFTGVHFDPVLGITAALNTNQTYSLRFNNGASDVFPHIFSRTAFTETGTLDASGATRTAPVKVGTSLPPTCTVGDLYFKSNATAGQNIYECQSTNIWTQQTPLKSVGQTFAGGGSALTAGTTIPSAAWCSTIPSAGTVESWDARVDTGTATFKVWYNTSSTADPTVSDSLNTSGVGISTGTRVHSTTFSDFTGSAAPSFAANSNVCIQLSAVSGSPTQATFSLNYR